MFSDTYRFPLPISSPKPAPLYGPAVPAGGGIIAILCRMLPKSRRVKFPSANSSSVWQFTWKTEIRAYKRKV